MKNFWLFFVCLKNEKIGVKMERFLEYFCVIFWVNFMKILCNFENMQSDVFRIDASENSRSLSNESLNIGGVPYKLVKVHLTKLMN